MFEVSQQDCSSPYNNGHRPPPRRLLPPAIPISQPVRSGKFTNTTTCPTSSHVHAKHDLIVWFEILELGGSQYVILSVIFISPVHLIYNLSSYLKSCQSYFLLFYLS